MTEEEQIRSDYGAMHVDGPDTIRRLFDLVATLRAKLADAESAHEFCKITILGTEKMANQFAEQFAKAEAALTQARADLDSLRLGRQGLLNELAEAQRVRDCVADERDQARAEVKAMEARLETFKAIDENELAQARAEAAHAAEDARKFALEAVNEIEKRERAEAALRECRELAERDFSDLVIEEIDAYFTQQTQKGTE